MNPYSFLVAHRGDRAGGPENSLAAFAFAVAAGARYLEGDVQLSSDGVAIVRHDATRRHLETLRHAEPDLLPLSGLLAWLAEQPVRFFLEIKPEVLRRETAAELVPRILPAPLPPQLTVISASTAVLEAVHAWQPSVPLGWVERVSEPVPDCPLAFVFCERKQLTAAVERWRAVARIVCYTINRAHDVPALLAAGADLVETDHFSRMRRELSHADASL